MKNTLLRLSAASFAPPFLLLASHD